MRRELRAPRLADQSTISGSRPWRKGTWKRPALVVVASVALLAGLAIILLLVRSVQGTPCDAAMFRVGTSTASAASYPALGDQTIAARLHRAFHGSSPAVFCNDFPDPFVLRVGGSYYAYSTGTDYMHIPVLLTSGIFGGGGRHNALPVMPSWSDHVIAWAPSVLRRGNRFVMYYAPALPDGRHCLSIAVSTDPAGPFTDHTRGPFVCPPGGAIDPSPYVAPDGQPYLVWKNGADIVAAPLTADGLALAGNPTWLLSAAEPWEHGIVEAPSMISSGGKVYLFYSGGHWNSAEYAIGYARCATPLGPCTRASTRPWLSSNRVAQGPGGQEFFTDQAGNLWMVFHAWIDNKIGYPVGARNLFVVRITFAKGIPQVT